MINKNLLDEFEKLYDDNPSNSISENAISRLGIKKASLNPRTVSRHSFVFSDEVERGEITNQKKSGRCWMFSGLNVVRVETMKRLDVDNFEFSETYLQFFDKLEKANSYLENIIETKELDIWDRLVTHIIYNAVEDGGYWHFFSTLAKKYGLVPKECMPESFESSNTKALNEALDIRLKRAAMNIRKSKSLEDAYEIKEEALYEVYNICAKTIGIPPKTVEYEYRDKKNNFHRISGITPVEFMEKYVPFDFDEKIELINDPRDEYEKGRLYQIPYASSVYEKGPLTYLNVTMDELKKATIASLKDGIPVWFACDVGKDSNGNMGILDNDLYNFDITLTEMGDFSKEDRLLSCASSLTHAMTFVGVDLDDNGNPIRWKVENSWGDAYGRKGIFSMSDKWFNTHNYEVVVNKKYISGRFLEGLEKDVIVLPFYDGLLG